MKKDIDYYMQLPYTIELRQSPGEGWFVRIKELPGCMSQGDTPEDALEMIQDAMRGWLEVSLEDGDPIPEPRSDEDFSGRFVVRVSKSLHRDLVNAASEQGISLNQYIGTELARAVGRSTPILHKEETLVWPGLKASLKRVLLAAGYSADAAALDEQLFSEWLQAQIAQVQAGMESGDLFGAQNYIQNTLNLLVSTDVESPAIHAISQLLHTMATQVSMIHELRERIVDVKPVFGRITQFASQRSRVMAHGVLREEAVGYTLSSLVPTTRQSGESEW